MASTSPARQRVRDAAPEPVGPVAVDNRTHHIKVFWTRDVGKDGAVEAPSTRRQGHNRSHRVLPGLNDSIPRVVWALMLENNGWKEWIESEALVVIGKPPTEWSESNALDLIKRSACTMSMRRWLKLEKRPEITEVLEKKIREMMQMATGKPVPEGTPLELA